MGSRGKLSSIGGSQSTDRPYVTRISERMERLDNVLGSVNFNNFKQCAINPGLPECFPWLSTIAQNYELYSFSKLWFEYRTTSGEVVSGSNPAIGKVIFCTNYDVIAPPFQYLDDMENYEGNCNFPPYQTIARHSLDVAGRGMGAVLPYKRRYVRSGPVPSQTEQGGAGDPHAYDIGLFQVGTIGMPAAGNQVGELWVGYSVDLIKPKVATSSAFPSWSAYMATIKLGADPDPMTFVPESSVYYAENDMTATFDTTGLFRVSEAPIGNYILTLKGYTGDSGVAIASVTLSGLVSCFVQANDLGFQATSISVQEDTDPRTFTAYVMITTLLPSFQFKWNVSVAGTAFALGVMNIYGTISRTNLIKPAPLLSVFKPRHLVERSEMEDLRQQVARLALQLEEKEDAYSVVSDLARGRGLNLIPAPSRDVSPSKRF